MIKFFRKIRQNFLSEGKTGKYLTYAIGEIVLVVIGILIALSINNWNENRKNRILEQEVLKDLKEEYVLNLSQLEQKIGMRNAIIQNSKDVLHFIDNSEFDINRDTLIHKIRYLGLDPTFDPIQNDLITSGKIRLIQNKPLRKLLSSWTSDILALQEMERQWQILKTDLNIPYQISLGIFRDMVHSSYESSGTPIYLVEKNNDVDGRLFVGKSKKTPSSEKILQNAQLESMMANAIAQCHSTNMQALALKKRIELIIDLLNTEIKK